MMPFDNSTTHLDNSIYFALCDNMREGAAIVEIASGKFIYSNRSFLKLFAIPSLQEIDISRFRTLRKDKLTPANIAAREKIIAEKGSFNELVEYMPLTGNSFFGEVTVINFFRKEKGYYLLVINPVDRAFFELASLGILMVNELGVIVTVNPFVTKQFGYEKKEIIGKKIELLIPARYHHNHVQHRKNFADSPHDRAVGNGKEMFALRKDGTEFPVEVSLGHYPSDGDKYTIAFINDISIRQMAIEEARKLHAELESKVIQRTKDLQEILYQLELSRNELQRVNTFQKTLLDNAGAIIVSVDENGIIRTFNPEAERELGYSAAEMVGNYTPQIFHDPAMMEARAKELSAELNRYIAPGMDIFFVKAQLGLENNNEWIYVRKDGTKFPVQLTVSAMRNDQHEIAGYVGVAFDISKTKKIEQELTIALKNEKELNELKSRFVTMASHEFRTPLSTILSSAYLIEKYTEATDQAKRQTHLQRVVASVTMLTDILNDFLSVGKIEEGKIQVRFSYFNIREMTEALLETIDSTLKPGQNINYHHEGGEVVQLDESLLKHIVMNLVSNAIKFSPESGAIDIKSSCNEDAITLRVKDHGIGIAKADQVHLMERFFRGANAGNIQGTGLGLHIVAKYAELLNGVVECESELDKGTEFSVTFTNKTI